jgi:hypothetical protein
MVACMSTRRVVSIQRVRIEGKKWRGFRVGNLHRLADAERAHGRQRGAKLLSAWEVAW